MRIDRTNPLDSLGLPEGVPASKSKPGQPAAASPKVADASQPELVKPFIEQAKQTPEINAEAVEEARRLLQTGQLDTPQAALRAAQKLLSLGQ